MSAAADAVSFVPGKNSWATPDSAARTKAEVRPLLLKHVMLVAPTTTGTRTILEVASGFGEHITFFAEDAPKGILFQPTEAQDECISGIAERVRDIANVLPPLELNALSSTHWAAVRASALKDDRPIAGIFLLNMLHISPWDSTVSLFKHAAELLSESKTALNGEAFVAVYGAFRRNGEFSGDGDRKFEVSLKNRDQRWGIRDLDGEVIPEAAKNGFEVAEIIPMNYNNWFIVWKLK
ncbi:uncharacterized protein V1518DRAFT_406347 [Limtongia smithiae]|uniref:uncharacterized protein n=1 Tax=Limtongia smithiae TaxID=1125753 RepID=UPI0034CE3B06